MLYVQSLWSKPLFDEQLALKKIGWLNKRAFYYGVTLSALLLDKYNPNDTLLITDKLGKKLLIDILELPYKDVVIELDCLNNYDAGLWALGKIYSYTIINKPFIHFDNDFFICSRLPNNIEKSELCAWTPEVGRHFEKDVYQPALNNFIKEYKNLHPMVDFFIKEKYLYAYNAGILGGNNFSFFKELKDIVFFLINKNTSVLEKNHTFNIILEQYIFACLAHYYKKEVTCLEENFPPMYFSKKQAMHLLGYYKNEVSNCKDIEDILKIEFVEHYKKINELLRKNII
jgi:conserved domain protein